MTLKSFPRGGRKPEKNFIQNDNSKKKSKPKQKRSGFTSTASFEDSGIKKLIASSADCLNYDTLTQGMVVLGRVREAREYDMIVSLPGRLIGRLELTDISDSYTKLLQSMIHVADAKPEGYKSLPQLYQPGDYLVCYVKSLNLKDKWRVSLSLEPELINQNLDRTRIVQRSKIVGSVSSVEEHGYVIDTGVANLRTFLSTKDVDEEKQYFVGQQLFLVIKDVKTSESASTITVSAKTKHNNKSASNNAQLLDALVPGARMILTIKKVLSNGLQVSFNDDNIGYINQIYLDKPPTSYSVDATVHGTLLYVLPTVKFGYFSLLSEDREKETIEVGDIIPAASVLCKEHKGILLKLPKNLRGYIPLRRTGVDFEKIKTTFLPNTKHKCRVLNYDWFDRVYICSMEKDVLNQKHFTATNFVPGELCTAEITRIDLQYKSINLKVDRAQGYVPPEHISDFGKNIIDKLKVGQNVNVRVLKNDAERNRILFTMKPSLVQSSLPILGNIKEAKTGSQHHGTVVQVKNTGILVQFFGDLKGWVAPQWIGCEQDDIKKKFAIGQVVAATIIRVDPKSSKMNLSLVSVPKEELRSNLIVGKTIEGIVTESSPQGVQVEIQKEDGNVETGYLPAAHMSPSLEVASLLSARCTPGDKISATVFSTRPNVILTTTFTPVEKLTDFENLKVGNYLPCSVAEIANNSLKVLLPVNDYDRCGTVPFVKPEDLESLYINQMLFGKILSVNKKERKIELTTNLYDLWVDSVKQDAEMANAADTLGLYLNKITELSKHDYYKSRPISKASLGQRVAGQVVKVTEHGLVLNLENDLQGTVRKEHYKKNFKVGDKVSGAIIWLNYVHEIVEVTLKPTVVERIATDQTTSTPIPLGKELRSEILLITNWFVLVVLKGQGNGRLAALPARRHLNDVEPDLRPYQIGRKVKTYVVLDSDELGFLPVCVLSTTFETRKVDVIPKSDKNSQKRKKHDVAEENVSPKKAKLEQKNETTSKTSKRENQKSGDCNSSSEPKKKKSKKSKVETENSESVQKEIEILEKNVTNDKKVEITDVGIPECGFYWDTEPTPQLPVAESSSESEEETESTQKQKKKKLSAAERRELERQKEREIREREEALASNQLPNSVDQFDRLVMSSPDSSVVWVQYMAYHLQATEFEKARAVAKRAIKTINFREENEKLNVWQAWLNLESRFGTLETLNEVFQEAVRTNDAFKVYTHMLTLHADAKRQTALEKTITTITGKFKQNPQAWIESGSAYLQMGLKDKSRHTMQRALQSLPAHQHVDLMVRFAQLENRFGDKERAQTLFEKVLSSYPKRVDVWSAYVDALVKSGDIPIARNVLERATAQTLPARKMKTIFKKYIGFEEQHGTAENVANVQQMARTYVENQCQQ